jgi:hypothetical protein
MLATSSSIDRISKAIAVVATRCTNPLSLNETYIFSPTGRDLVGASIHPMKPSIHGVSRPLLAALALPLLFAGCAVSPDYSNYDWHERGGMVGDQDRSLAGAKIEPFRDRNRTVRSDVSITPTGAPSAAEQSVIIDPTRPDVVAEGVPRTVGTRSTR